MGAAGTLVWVRSDLRLADNPALTAALARGGPVVPVFVWAPEEEAPWPPGGASRWWLHQSLRSHDQNLRRIGSGLIIRRGETLKALRALAKETGANGVVWNRRYEPVLAARDARVKYALREAGLHVEEFNAALLREPWTIKNKSGRPFQVFTAFWRHCLGLPAPEKPLPAPKRLPALAWQPRFAALDALELEPRIDWAKGLRLAWTPGEAGAGEMLETFLPDLDDYDELRDFPGSGGTSRLSPHLHFGEISPRQIWDGVARRAAKRGHAATQARTSRFLAELGWREFAHHLLHHFPHTPAEPLRPEFKRFPWRKNAAALRAWQKGCTGFPMVDAGMRELWTIGWMHNRVRMIVASFLVKDLLLPWQEGARWFWDALVDADLAQNTLGWQWTAGCGADAAPYFRVFNPTSQGEKFDTEGAYVRRWCPELAELPNRWIHAPHRAPPEVLQRAGVQPGRTYPEPIVNHAVARTAALQAFARMKSANRR